jgi:Zinc finger, C2H2 type
MMSERTDQSGDHEIGTCHVCGRTFPTQEELSRHLMDEHESEKLDDAD